MPQRSAMCLVIDRLPGHLVGAYGNSWIHTPALDVLAAESLLIEFAMIDSPRLGSIYRSYWQGRHAACPDSTSPDLATLLRDRGVRSRLLTDEPVVAGLEMARRFDELIELPTSDRAATADSLESTGLARFFAAAAELLAGADSPSLTWLHSRGLSGPWDAPLDFRRQYADEEDPPPPESAEVPSRLLAADHDPDERLGLAQACAGQVTAADACLGVLLDVFRESPLAENTLLIVVGARGFPLGEHLRVGESDEALYAELLHVPLLVRSPGAAAVPLRSAALAQPPDLFRTLLDWWGIPIPTSADAPAGQGGSLLAIARGESERVRDRAIAVGNAGEWAIRTPAWFLRRPAEPRRDRDELFVKPDDRFEVNDVSSRCGDVADRLSAAGAEFLQAARADSEIGSAAGGLTPLDDTLVSGA